MARLGSDQHPQAASVARSVGRGLPAGSREEDAEWRASHATVAWQLRFKSVLGVRFVTLSQMSDVPESPTRRHRRDQLGPGRR